jgi:hypothetical protein
MDVKSNDNYRSNIESSVPTLACEVLMNLNRMFNANYRDQNDGRLDFDKIN